MDEHRRKGTAAGQAPATRSKRCPSVHARHQSAYVGSAGCTSLCHRSADRKRSKNHRQYLTTRTEERRNRTEKQANTKSTGSPLIRKLLSPKFTQTKFTLTQTRFPKITSWNPHKHWENQIISMHESRKTRTQGTLKITGTK